MSESSKNKIQSIPITVEVCKTILKNDFDFLVTSVYILALYFRQTVCKEIQEKAKGKMDNMASVLYNSLHMLTPSKEKQRKMKCLVLVIKKERLMLLFKFGKVYFQEE